MIKSNPRMTQSDLQAFRVFLQQKTIQLLAKQLCKYFWEDLKPL